MSPFRQATTRTISVIIPTRNQQQNVGDLAQQLQSVLAGAFYSYEIIFVDAGSTDGTAAAVKNLAPGYHARVLLEPETAGMSEQLLAGCQQARYDIIAALDIDPRYLPENLAELAERVLGGSDIVVGNSGSGISRLATRLLHGLDVDLQSGVHVFNRQLVEHMQPGSDFFDLSFLLTARDMGCVINPADLTVRGGLAKSAEALQKTNPAKPHTLARLLKLKFSRERLVPFSASQVAGHGQGFYHKGSSFVPHTTLAAHHTAFETVTHRQKVWLAGILVFLAAAFILNWRTTLFSIIVILTLLYFIDLLFNFVLIYRSFSKKPEITFTPEQLHGLKDEDLPVYTIFCPLYKEWAVLPQFAQAMKNIDYPKNRLQIILLLEEDDTETIKRAKNFDLPENFEIRVVPHSFPKTKPKAMNYGLRFVKGDYITIYDAEDVPEPLQLKKAVLAFAKLGPKVVCVQGKLNFYNPDQNFVTRLFTAEYSLWFDLVLPGLQSLNIPIPLGGTSNHFRVASLRELKGWDAFNVTEDCDLGIRLARLGYRTAIIESTTYEEANSDLLNWYRQRSRWIKGYMQTYLVHMRFPKLLWKNWKQPDLLTFQLVVGGKIVSMFVNPLLWAITIIYFLFRAHVAQFIEPFFPSWVLYFGVFSLVFGNFLYLYYYMIGLSKRHFNGLVRYVFIVPFYWLGMSAAALKAGYEVIFKPHYWAKTVHGLHLSKQQAKLQSRDVQVMRGAAPSYYEKLKTLWNGNMGSGGFYVIAIVAANFLNFLFNALLGRTLTLEDFGTVTLFNTILAILSVFLGSLTSAINFKTAFLTGKGHGASTVSFVQKTQKYIWYIAAAASLIWIALVPAFASYFHIERLALVLMFTPVFAFGGLASMTSGYLLGRFHFNLLGRSTIYEALSKLLFAMALVAVGFHAWAAASIPGSILVYFAFNNWYVRRVLKKQRQEAAAETAAQAGQALADTRFPMVYFWAAVVSGIAGTSFLNVDVLLAKHYLDPTTAGAYALLSLIGKMVYFLGSLLSAFIISIISRHEGAGTNPRKDFYRLFNGTVVCTALAFLGFGVFGKYTIPIMFGHSSLAVLPYLFNYALAMVLFTLTTTLISYHLAKREYSFVAVSLASAVLLVLGIVKYHSGISDLTNVMLFATAVNFASVFGWHAIVKNSRFVLRNITDMFDVFMPLPKAPHLAGGKRILIFNWRDTKHNFAGGAETYIHELAKRWVAAGNEVTLFCGNDGQSPRDEIVDGVRVVRRGGFYFVYVWAFWYYIVKFRGRYDVIIDCQNGIPFFTPLYAKEQVYCLMHHVHQEVFHKYLFWPLAKLASFLEKTAMPFVYRNTKFITVSNSSRQEMANIGLGLAGTEVIFPGVDLDVLQPGQRSENPIVLYLGRLKAYKSVEVLIHAFKPLAEKNSSARLVIAGGGEHEGALRRLADKLNLTEFIDFTGKVSDREKLGLLQRAWVFVNPSMMEGWGITSIEANACGVPVVAADVPGLRDSVQNPHTGYLVEHGNSEKFSQKIDDLITDQGLWEEMSQGALDWAKNFDWNKSSETFLSLLQTDTLAPNNMFNRETNLPSPQLPEILPSHLPEGQAAITAKSEFPRIAKPNLWNFMFGAAALIIKNKFQQPQAGLPKAVGPYTFLSEIIKDDLSASLSMGIYELSGKKYIVKHWQGKVKDLTYYFLVNEYRANRVLYPKIMAGYPEFKVKLPELADCFVTKNSLSLVFEYIEGVTAAKLPQDEQVAIWRSAARSLAEVSGRLATWEKAALSTKTFSYYLAMVPVSAALVMLFSPKTARVALKALGRSFKFAKTVNASKLMLAHRDLTPSNIMVKDGDIYLLDLENVAMTTAGYDFAFLSVQPKYQELAALLAGEFTGVNSNFLRYYILLHHILGSGSFFSPNQSYINLLNQLNDRE